MFAKHLRIELVSAEPYTLISEMTERGMEIFEITQDNVITLCFNIKKAQYRMLKKTVAEKGGSCKIIGRDGYLWRTDALKYHPVLVAGVLLFILLSAFLSERVLFIQVEGNDTVPSKMILEQAASCGIRFGSSRRAVRSEMVKNELLSKIPQLQWVGVNTEGSTATIRVKERSAADKEPVSKNTVSGIVAFRDGVVSKCTVLKGTALCREGQSVKQGDLLVSGYTDCGLKVVAQHADAEIFAYTLHQDQLVAIKPVSKREACTSKHSCKSVRVGKKVIKLCNHSGIPDVTCVKMYREDYLTFPGGFQLPVAIITEEYRSYDCRNDFEVTAADFSWMTQFAHDYLVAQMVSGRITHSDEEMTLVQNGCVLNVESYCEEMIGKVQYEETLQGHAEDN